MSRKDHVGASIDWLKTILADTNNELTSEQRSKLEKCIKDLKRIHRSSNAPYAIRKAVVEEVAKLMFEITMSGTGE